MKTTTLILALISFSFPSFATIRYVTSTGAGAQNGTSWANAAPGSSLQTLINASGSGDEIWVACGTYFPTNTANRNLAFSLKNGLTIYGSFEGTEITLSERVFACGACSILSGAIGAAGNADNSYHVISNPVGINNTAVVDGFVVQDANDNRSPSITDGLGGGFYNNGGNGGNMCSPTIRNCVIRNNFAQFGAGIFNSGHTGGNASPMISNCIITQNTAYLGGGGIDNFGLAGTASPTITNSLIYANTAVQRAGGMYCWAGNNGNANPTIINSVFANNSAVDGGGLVSDRGNSPPGSFSGNSNPVIFNSIFWGNTASGTGPQFFLIGSGTFNATYSTIDITNQNAPHILTGLGTGNVNINPQFTNIANAIGADNCWLSADDGLSLQNTSPLINAGNAAGSPANDILGALRTGNPDIGAYEYQVPLSIELLDFETTCSEGKVRLHWATAKEINHDSFGIERSQNGVDFSLIERIDAAGNSNEIRYYAYTDENPLTSLSYYRLKQTDFDGKYEYSSVKFASCGVEKNSFIIYPNPASNNISIHFSDRQLHKVTLFNCLGHLLLAENHNEKSEIAISTLPTGIYFLKVEGMQTQILIRNEN